jgi:hypothetical protein
MNKRISIATLALILTSITVAVLSSQTSAAVSQNLRISQVMVGDAKSASDEFVELYNNSLDDLDITNWCLYYASASSVDIGSKLGCFDELSAGLHVFIPGRTYAFAASTQFSANETTTGSDLAFAAKLAAAGGHVRLTDSKNTVIDKLGWGTAVSPESRPVGAPLIGEVLQRKLVSTGVLLDSDDNLNDFEKVPPRSKYSFGSIYEVQDLCLNLENIQTAIPDGYTVDDHGNCLPRPIDICINLDGLQAVLPEGYVLDADGKCHSLDLCQNIDGIQYVVPESYKLESAGVCRLDLLPLKLSELLANADGDDAGAEFIEIYNPNDEAVKLDYYLLSIGVDLPKLYNFPANSVINPKVFAVFYNNDIGFTLVNSSGAVSLVSVEGDLIDPFVAYQNPKPGEAWALIGDSWAYTNVLTPGLPNRPSAIIQDSVVVELAVTSQPCAPNQYRNSETNRCKLIAATGSIETPCKLGQYRSEETNRCRSLAADATTYAACGDGKERNPDTNRCRSVLGATTSLVPCTAGQERNPDTNRCRNVTNTIPDAGFAVEPIKVNSSDATGWWAFAGVSTAALGYAGWEWRVEAANIVGRLRGFFRGKK